MNRFLLSLTLTVGVLAAGMAQEYSRVAEYFNAGIDSLVAASKVIGEYTEEEKTDPVYARLFTAPVLYRDVLGTSSGSVESGAGNLDGKRKAVMDGLLLEVYRNAPHLIAMTEDEVREAKPVQNETRIEAPVVNVVNVDIPDKVAGDMKTTLVKRGYWTFNGKVALRFSQNFISGNWYQGGESNKTMLGEVDLDLNYDDKNRVTITNHLDVDLGFATSEADTLHSFMTNTDRLKLETTVGYRLVKNLDIAARMALETQMLASYPVNTPDYVSNFMAPFDANFSIGLNFKPKWRNFAIEVYFAPLSAYNYKFVRHGELVTRYGIREGRHHLEDFGTQLIVTVPTVKLFKIVDFWTKAEYYTNYVRSFFQMETKFDIALTKYFSASLSMHARFDDSAPGLYDEDYGYWQFKELMTLGLTYSW